MDEQKSAIKHAFKIATQPGPDVEPLDWLDTVTPQKWRFGDEEIYFNWYAE
jgi:alpha-galactosidase